MVFEGMINVVTSKIDWIIRINRTIRVLVFFGNGLFTPRHAELGLASHN